MIIDFEKISETVIKNFKGGEKETVARMYVDDLNKIMFSRLAAGASIGLHTHESGSEAIYILKGHGKAIYDGAEESVAAGECHYCPKGHSHSLINNSDDELVFFAVVPEQ